MDYIAKVCYYSHNSFIERSADAAVALVCQRTQASKQLATCLDDKRITASKCAFEASFCKCSFAYGAVLIGKTVHLLSDTYLSSGHFVF